MGGASGYTHMLRLAHPFIVRNHRLAATPVPHSERATTGALSGMQGIEVHPQETGCSRVMARAALDE